MMMQIFAIISPVLVCAIVGYVWAQRKVPYETKFVSRIVTNVGVPALVFSALVKADVGAEALSIMGFAALVTICLFVVISLSIFKLTGTNIKTFLPCMIFANIGNIGIPLCFLAFGAEGLSLAVVYFTISALLMFTVGVSIASGNIDPSKLIKEPLVWAAVLAMVVKINGWNIPDWITNSTDMLGSFAIPLMLITLGVSLAELKISSLGRSFWLSMLRLIMGFGVGYFVAYLFDFEGVERGVLIIQSTMPVAVFNFLHAMIYDNRPQEVAGTIVLSTLISFITLPALLWYVL